MLESSTPTFQDDEPFPVVRVVCEVILLVALIGIVVFLYLRQGTAEVAQVGGESSTPVAEALSVQSLFVPTLALEPIEQPSPDFSAQLIGEQGGIQIHYFTKAEAARGFIAPADAHVIFDCPDDIAPAIDVTMAHTFGSIRSWGYEYSNQETNNRKAGKTGRELFDGRFWLSPAELAVTGEQYGALDTKEADGSPMQLHGSKRYYVMVDGTSLGDADAVYRVSCLDSDQDGLHNGVEDLNGDGIVDAGETNPQSADTDGGGALDGAEDADHDGVVDAGETDPRNVADDPAPVCGDGTMRGTETCDDGNTVADDGCSVACTIESGWECAGSPSMCQIIVPTLPDASSSSAESAPVDAASCGNGILEAPETCDDGNMIDGDGCSAACLIE
ncbi:MAG TPA: DUF4215 domain-containing protein [Candidatus Peribacterales bacterium]|nr:DUF4215 domain-containing protein [Candidatus Peribacterales bacterium]